MQIEPFSEDAIVPLPPGREHLAVSPELRARKRELARGVAEGLNGYFEGEGHPFEAYEYTTETGRLTSVGVSDKGNQFVTIRVTNELELIFSGLKGYVSKVRKVEKWLRECAMEYRGKWVHVVYAQPQSAPAAAPAVHRPSAPPKQLRVSALVHDVSRAVKMPDVLAQIEAELDRHGLRGKLRAAVRASVLKGG